MFDIKWKNCGLLGAGILLGSYGLRILTSRDAKKAYTHGTAAVFRMKDEVRQWMRRSRSKTPRRFWQLLMKARNNETQV